MYPRRLLHASGGRGTILGAMTVSSLEWLTLGLLAVTAFHAWQTHDARSPRQRRSKTK